MRSASPDEEREVLPERAQRVAAPMLVSIVLHGALLYLLTLLADIPPAEAIPAAERAAVRVSVVMRTPARAIPEAPSLTPDVPLPVPDTAVEIEATEQAAALPPTEPVAAPLATDSGIAESGDDAASAATLTTSQDWTPARVRAAISATSVQRRSSVTEAWLSDCLVEQKTHGTRECEEQQQEQDYASTGARAARDAAVSTFERITAAQRGIYLTDQFARENAALDPMMEEGGLLGAVAAQRYYLNREYMLYLNGNGAEPLWGAMGNFRADPLGGPRLSLPGSLGTLFICKKGPCFYRYTGFEIERPETSEEGSFRVVPFVPGARR